MQESKPGHLTNQTKNIYIILNEITATWSQQVDSEHLHALPWQRNNRWLKVLENKLDSDDNYFCQISLFCLLSHFKN